MNKAAWATRLASSRITGNLTLTRLIAGVFLVDHVYATLAPDDLAGAAAFLKGFERISDFHGLLSFNWRRV